MAATAVALALRAFSIPIEAFPVRPRRHREAQTDIAIVATRRIGRARVPLGGLIDCSHLLLNHLHGGRTDGRTGGQSATGSDKRHVHSPTCVTIISELIMPNELNVMCCANSGRSMVLKAAATRSVSSELAVSTAWARATQLMKADAPT